MFRSMCGVIVLAAIAAPAVCHAQIAPEIPVPWVTAPDIAYPAAAAEAGVEDTMTINCVGAGGGRLTRCVASEDPHGMGAAAIAGLNNAVVDLEAMPHAGEGLSMRLRVRFRLDEGPAVRVALLPSVVTNPRWAVRPMPRYPDEGAGQVGEVRLSCTVLTSGRLGECDIVSETPPGFGFGREAVAAARRASLEARESEGTVSFPMRFRP